MISLDHITSSTGGYAQKMTITLRSGKEGEEMGSNASLFRPNNVLHMFVCLCLLAPSGALIAIPAY